MAAGGVSKMHFQLLSEAFKAFSRAGLDLEQATGTVARRTAELLGDGCVVCLEDDGGIRPMGVAHPDPEAQRLLYEMVNETWTDPESLAAEVTRSGQPIFAVIQKGEKFSALSSPAAERFLEQVGACSIIVVPLLARGQVIGTLGVSRDQGSLPYQEADLELLQQIADHAAIAIDNARLVRLRDDFLALAGHELNTPLTALRLQLRGLERMAHQERGEATPELMSRRVEAAARHADRLSALVRQLLTVSRLTMGRPTVKPQVVDLAGLVREVAQQFQESAAQLECELQLHVPERLEASGDRDLCELILSNLLSNALRYGRGGPVELLLKEEGTRALLSVRDRGIGIAPADQERIFQRFERAVSDRHYGGLGLGLWLARQSAEALGGTIQVESAPGQGSTFTAELPMPTAEANR